MTDRVDELLEARHLDPDVSMFAPETLQEVRDRLEYIDDNECNCGESQHENALHDLAHDDVPALLHVIDLLAERIERVRAMALNPIQIVDGDRRIGPAVIPSDILRALEAGR